MAHQENLAAVFAYRFEISNDYIQTSRVEKIQSAEINDVAILPLHYEVSQGFPKEWGRVDVNLATQFNDCEPRDEPCRYG